MRKKNYSCGIITPSNVIKSSKTCSATPWDYGSARNLLYTLNNKSAFSRNSFMSDCSTACKALFQLTFLFLASFGFGQGTQSVTLTSGTSWSVPCGVTSITVEAWGGGGGGSYRNIRDYDSGAAGGGGSAYARMTIPVTAEQTINYSIGTGGSGGTDGSASSNQNNGLKNGKPTTISSSGWNLSVDGGKGALDNTVENNKGTYGNGGVAPTQPSGVTITNWLTYAGGKGGRARNTYSGGGGGAGHSGGMGGNGLDNGGNSGNSANGGSSSSPGGKGANGVKVGNHGANGLIYGGGGSGTFKLKNSDTTNDNGGAGAPGGIRITYTTTINTVTAASSTPTLCVNTALPAITHATTGATGIAATTNNYGLPPGITGSWANDTITISGKPTVAGTFNYSIPLIGGCGDIKAIGTITANALPTTYTVTGGGNYCSGDSGIAVGLNGSQTGVNYQLKLGGVNSGSSVAGTGLAISFGNRTAAGTYTVIATHATTACTASMIDSVVVSINPAPTLTGASQAVAVCAGSAAVIKLTGLLKNSISTIEYTFRGATQLALEVKADSSGSGTFNTPALTSSDNYGSLFITKITTTSASPNCGISTNNRYVQLFVKDAFNTGSITTTGQTICYNTVPTTQIGSAAGASGGDSNISYQWQYSTDSNFPFGQVTTIINNSPNYQPTQTLTQTTYYRRQAKDGSCSTNFTNSTGVWAITVTPVSVGGTISGGDSSICQGSSTGTLTLSGYTGKIIRWERKINTEGWNSIGNGGNTTFSESPNNPPGTWEYRAVVQNGNCSETYSSVKKIQVDPIPVGGGINKDGLNIICFNSSTGTMTLGNGYIGNVIRWEKKLSSATSWTPISNTTNTYSEIPSQSGVWEYRAVVGSGSCGEVNSSNYTLTVSPELTISLVDTNSTACYHSTSSTLSYTATTGNASAVKIVFDSAANSAGVKNVSYSGVSAGSGTITIQYDWATVPGIYHGVLTVMSDNPSCLSSRTYPVTLTINDSIPQTPPTAAITQPNCTLSTTGSVVLSGLPLTGTIVQTGVASATYTITTGGSQTISELAPGTYDFAISNGCSTSNKANVVINPVTNTWNGKSWSNAGKIPTIDQQVIFASNYNTITGDITACSCEINTGVILTIGKDTSATIQNNIINYGNIIIESDGNLVQNNNDGTYTGSAANFIVKRNSNLKRLDYTYWASPVKNQNLKSFSPGTLNNRFLVYKEEDDLFTDIVPTNNIFGNAKDGTFASAAKGYAIRAYNTYPAATPTTPAPIQLFKGEFKGIPNNGVITFPLKKTSNGYNLVGNPYASNLDFETLYNNNSANINYVAYFWTNVNPNPVMQGQGYPGTGFINNYAVLNGTGGVPATEGTVATGPTGTSKKPNRYIKVGQGFIVKAINNADLQFKNTVRTSNTTSVFFNKNGSTPDRYWLQLTTPLEVTTTQLIGYLPQATNGFELDYDAPLMVVGSDAFYSLLDDRKLTIQGKAPFVNTDVVDLGSSQYEVGNYTISLSEKEGVFANGQNIYLKDKQTGTLTNLSENSYAFTANKGLTEGRFEIVYLPQIVLGAESFAKEGLSIYRDGDDFIVKSFVKNITKLEVYDASGRLLAKLQTNQKEIRIDAGSFVNGMYVLKIDREGNTVTKKIRK